MTDDIFDVLVIGSGAAGLSAALEAARLGARVGVLTAGPLAAGSSPRAQGGVAAAVGADDSPSLHAADTVAVGGGLNDARAVAVLTREGGRSVADFGGLFESDLGLEAGHGRRRILHAGGGATGSVLTNALVQRATAHPRITLFDHAPVSALAVSDGRVTSALVGQHTFTARAVILATGGYAALWARSTNAPESCGAGLRLAWQAGATLSDLEFVQFHPTALDLPGRPAFLLSEALRGEGGRLVDAADNEVVDPLLPRDVVARALHRHIGQPGNGQVFLSLRHLPPQPIYDRFERLALTLREYGLDVARDRLPVAPAAHYCMGGVRTDSWGRTDVAGLYAAGEVACTGVQGANRLASNSLLECLVFGARAAQASTSDGHAAAAGWATRPLPDSASPVPRSFSGLLGERLVADLGVERDEPGLNRLVAELPAAHETSDPDRWLAGLIARAALLRAESRGAHFRTDSPRPDPAWRGRIHWRRTAPPTFEEVAS